MKDSTKKPPRKGRQPRTSGKAAATAPRQTLTQPLGALLAEAERGPSGPIPAAVRQPLLEDAIDLLERGASEAVSVSFRTITHGDLHRHLLVVRCPDQAFFLDGIKVYLAENGISLLGRHTVVLCCTRGDSGQPATVCSPQAGSHASEMLVALQISATLVPDGAALHRDLVAITHAVHLSVRDFAAMSHTLAEAAQGLRLSHPDAAALLGWMRDARYILFGAQADGRRLGILGNRATMRRVAPGLTDDLAALAEASPPAAPGLEWLYLPHGQRLLYGAAHLEVVRATWQGHDGNLESAVFLGHFSRSARHTNASQAPLLGRLWERMRRAPALARSAYLSREVRTLFDRLPKPVLLSVPEARLLATMVTICEAGNPERALVFEWAPHPGTVRLILTVVEASRYGRRVEQGVLGAVAASGMTPLHHYTAAVGPHMLLFVSALPPEGGAISAERLENLHHQIQECTITWRDRARSSVKAMLSGAELRQAMETLAALPHLYTDLFPAQTFVPNLALARRVGASGRPQVRLETTGDGVEMHIFTALPVPLGELVAVVQNFGLTALKEVVVEFPSTPPAHLTTLTCGYARPLHTEALPRLRLALEAVLSDLADNDPANALVLAAGLDSAAVAVITALRNHLVQLVADAGPGALTRTLNAWPRVTAALYAMFAARHAPPPLTLPETPLSPSAAARIDPSARARKDFDAALAEVRNLTDDRWFRHLAELVTASLRTNAFTRPSGAPLAVKIDPSLLSFAPRPLPWREIFVHGRHVEGVHLRMGPVARGGLRLSDRPGDFRTEVLELMATQQLKNSIIVPAGAKGGFVLKNGSGAAFTRAQYSAFVNALLTVTDNRVGAEIVPPAGVRVAEQDAHDPYLVVAADKGTASFSDLANAESAAAGFWLDDAFASGGSHGYDHKVYGITARGAWVCVRHHFAHLGLDPDKDPVTVAGIGDMGGDVFGNGMLQSRTLRLIAAFNHAHVFLDPDPDARAAFRERSRLFRNPGGWDQYNPERISPGGGVFDRSAKRIAVSPQAAAALGVDPGPMSGEELIRAILKAPVDLLYNGGIGTYVKATTERDEEARDPANNPVRVNAADLRCKVVGEGGNLGFTQRARIEYARGGGRINTDAIDNSGGVDMSDHEVNLKILLTHASGAPRGKARDRLLAGVGDQVAAQCLTHNRSQSRAISLARQEIGAFPPRLRRLRNRLVLAGELDPDTNPGTEPGAEDTLALSPQLAVLLGHEKNRLTARLADAGFADRSPFAEALLNGYFPPLILRRFPRAVATHPLRAGIVHTMAATALTDRCGMLAVSHLEDLVEGAAVAAIAQALLAADHLLDAAPLRAAIRRVADLETSLTLEVALQGHLQHFAEELLRLHQADEIDHAWLAHKRGQFTRFARLLEKAPVGGHFEPLPQTLALPPEWRTRMAAMPVLARSGAALQSTASRAVPLSRALAAGRAVFDLLPLLTCENHLRSPAWGEGEPYLLRRAWLARLVRMRSHAIDRLLGDQTSGNRLPALRRKAGKGRNLTAVGADIWHRHPRWNMVAELAAHLAETPDAEPMRVVLLLTHLESLIDDTI
ncbi:MAG: NAD-glutamate dehydrogenase [Nitrospirota bacterium]|nr:NAD-glutamate dehydrogenase [Nitrospirota bacterium]